ncbi:MAG: VanZ family protein [Candidatus Woesearchaeota archaeon]
MKRLYLALFLFITANIALFYFALSKVDNSLRIISSGYHMHFIAFFGLSFFLSLILVHEKISLPAPFTLSFLYSFFIAFVIEILQAQTTYRVFSYNDILFGCLGALCYSILGLISYNSNLFHKYWIRV